MPLSHIKRAVLSSVPLGVSEIRKAGMEVYSKNFRKGKKKFLPTAYSDIRNQAIIYIRGDRRPYSIEIYVNREKRVKRAGQKAATFVENGQDESLAKLIRYRIQQQLTKRREDSRNIDEFRVF